LQYAAHEEKEYEIFYIRDAANKKCSNSKSALEFALSPTLAMRKDGNSCRYVCKTLNSFSQKSCDAANKKCLSTLNITQSLNRSDERYPVNGIHNKETVYQDITQDFCEKELSVLQTYLQELPSFRIARVGLRANSKADLLLGFFHIIEINLFAPFPIHLLDNSGMPLTG
jgi:hypothetical protein